MSSISILGTCFAVKFSLSFLGLDGSTVLYQQEKVLCSPCPFYSESLGNLTENAQTPTTRPTIQPLVEPRPELFQIGTRKLRSFYTEVQNNKCGVHQSYCQIKQPDSIHGILGLVGSAHGDHSLDWKQVAKHGNGSRMPMMFTLQSLLAWQPSKVRWRMQKQSVRFSLDWSSTSRSSPQTWLRCTGDSTTKSHKNLSYFPLIHTQADDQLYFSEVTHPVPEYLSWF